MEKTITIWHRGHTQTERESYYCFGFVEKDYAGKAKLEIGNKCMEFIEENKGSIHHQSLDNQSSLWWYNTSTIDAILEDFELMVTLGAKHKRKRCAGLPHAGVFSELVVCLYSPLSKFWDGAFSQKIKEYLTSYEPGFIEQK